MADGSRGTPPVRTALATTSATSASVSTAPGEYASVAPPPKVRSPLGAWAVGIALVDLEIRRRSESRHEFGQEELLRSVCRPVAVPDDVNDLGAGQDRAVVVRDRSIRMRRTVG